MRSHQGVSETVAIAAGTLLLLTLGGCGRDEENSKFGTGPLVPSSAGTQWTGGSPVLPDLTATGGQGGAVAAGGAWRVESSSTSAYGTGGGVAGAAGIWRTESSGMAGKPGFDGGVVGAGGAKGTAISGVGGATGKGGSSSGCGVLGCSDPVGGNTGVINTGKCGDGILDKAAGEKCDDGNRMSGDGCNRICQIEANWVCPTPGMPCRDLRQCGNGILTGDEMCEDANNRNGDGCSGDCMVIEPGFECRVPGRLCTPKCGDGMIVGSEQCDDGNNHGGDGCSSTCQIEPGADCPEVGRPCRISVCGNGVVEKGERCDCGDGSGALPEACAGPNGLFYGNGKGCSQTCTKEPNCLDPSGATRACDTACGDGNRDSSEECDDGNLTDGDGCSKECKIERDKGFSCSDKLVPDSSPCKDSANGMDCLRLPVIYRDFQPENAPTGGHPDFFFLGTRFNGSSSPTTVCVPNSAGPGRSHDSTKRCWGLVADKLVKGKPQPGATKTCDCRFSDWNVTNSSRIPGSYTMVGNDSPMSDGKGGYLGGETGAAVVTETTAGPMTGALVDFTTGTPAGPVWAGTVPAYKDDASFKQWFNDDSKVNKSFAGVVEMRAMRQLANGSTVYKFASKTAMANRSFAGTGFYPLDALNPSQATLCNLWPYWNHGNGAPFWSTCTGDQYLFPPRVSAADCTSGDTVDDGCFVTGVVGQNHNNYFTDEVRTTFVYNKDSGFELSFFGDDDLFVFINGTLVLDLGGVHQSLPGKLTIVGDPGNAQITEGGCLDAVGTITGVTAGSTACAPSNVSPTVPATEGADFRQRMVTLGLQHGKVYEVAIFGADRHPPESNYQLTLTGSVKVRSDCTPRCGDGLVSAGEECDCGDGSGPLPAGCPSKNDDTVYGGCTTQCKLGPFCGDGIVSEPLEQCDQGKNNGATIYGPDGCTFGCTIPHFCGDGILDTNMGEECDLGPLNGQKLDGNGQRSDSPTARVMCLPECRLGTVLY